jgi:cysteine desulfurase
MDSIYLDHNATTPTRPEVVEAMARCYAQVFANPASQHRPGQQARQALEDAREQIAQILDVDLAPPRRDRLIFTSGGTEANNLAILGMAQAAQSLAANTDHSPLPPAGEGQGVRAPQPGQIIISASEHHSLIEPAEHLLEQGWRLDTLGLTPQGVVRLEQLAALLSQRTAECSRLTPCADSDFAADRPPAHGVCGLPCLVSVQLGNHETGVLQPIGQLAALCNQAGVPLHTDAVQVVGKLPVSFRTLGVAAMSITAHKFRGPLGIGALIVRHSVPLRPLMFGGHQQGGLRPGTESAALAVGMATALDLWQREQNELARRLGSLRDRFEAQLRAELPNIVVHGVGASVGRTFLSAPGQAGMPAPPSDPRLPQTSNVAFPGLDGQVLLMALDLAGVACSVGSACSSGSTELSPTLRAMDLPSPLVASSLRFSFGATNTEAQIDEAVQRIVRVCRELRG